MTTTLSIPPARPSPAPQDFQGGLMGQTLQHLNEDHKPHAAQTLAQPSAQPGKQEALAARGVGQKVDKAV